MTSTGNEYVYGRSPPGAGRAPRKALRRAYGCGKGAGRPIGRKAQKSQSRPFAT